jgi:hypothetical protein
LLKQRSPVGRAPFFTRDFIDGRRFLSTHGRFIYIPQTLPVLQAVAELVENELELPPFILEAKVEIFFCTCELLQVGQMTVSTALELNTSSSNDSLQSVHSNS